MDTRHPVHLGNLNGAEGNAFCILGRCQVALKESGQYTGKQAKEILAEMQSGDYTHLLKTAAKHLKLMVDNGEVEELDLSIWEDEARELRKENYYGSTYNKTQSRA